MLKTFCLCCCWAVLWFESGCAGEEAPGNEQPPVESEPGQEDAQPESRDLGAYRPVVSGRRIKGARVNCSGLAWRPDKDRLYVVRNSPTDVMELDRDGRPLRRIALRGFWDTEGITHIEGDRFAVVEEGRRELVFIEIGAETDVIDYDDCTRILVDEDTGGNKGLEGLTYDAAKRRFFAVKERSIRKIYRINLPENDDEDAEPTVSNPWDIQNRNMGLSDLSGIWFDSRTGNLLILSDESRALVECTPEGEALSRLPLDTPQAEGVAMDGDGRIYICSEPDLLYTYTKPQDGEAPEED